MPAVRMPLRLAGAEHAVHGKHLFVAHPRAVVGNEDLKFFLRGNEPQHDPSAKEHPPERMGKYVFHNRLEHQLWDAHPVQIAEFALHTLLERKLARKANGLNAQKAVQVLQLVAYGHQRIGVVHAVFEHGRKRGYNIRHIHRAALDGEAADRIQRIIQKMGVDLVLQRVQLLFALLKLYLAHIPVRALQFPLCILLSAAARRGEKPHQQRRQSQTRRPPGQQHRPCFVRRAAQTPPHPQKHRAQAADTGRGTAEKQPYAHAGRSCFRLHINLLSRADAAAGILWALRRHTAGTHC